MRAASHQSRRLKGKRSTEKERSGRDLKELGSNAPSQPGGDVLTGRKRPPRGRREAGREGGREGQRQAGRSEGGGGGGGVSQPMWQKVWLLPLNRIFFLIPSSRMTQAPGLHPVWAARSG